MSDDLSVKIQLGLGELETVQGQISSLLAQTASSNVGDIQTAAACAMLHSFYTEMEKILKLVAQDWDDRMPESESWHKELLKQMAAPTDKRQAVLTPELMETMGEFLAFRHLFRGASIALMRWEKLSPLVEKVEPTFLQFTACIESFRDFNLR